jgi:hypothetical protein
LLDQVTEAHLFLLATQAEQPVQSDIRPKAAARKCTTGFAPGWLLRTARPKAELRNWLEL